MSTALASSTAGGTAVDGHHVITVAALMATFMFFGVGFVLLSTLALTAAMLEGPLNYPIDTSGYMTLARGVTLVGPWC